jgi:hypothetical protein
VLNVDAMPDRPGYSAEDLEGDPASLAQLLERVSEDGAWVAFLVDDDSLAVFREARTIASRLGIPSGWDPGTLSFPHREALTGGGRGGPTRLGQIQ